MCRLQVSVAMVKRMGVRAAILQGRRRTFSGGEGGGVARYSLALSSFVVEVTSLKDVSVRSNLVV